MQTTGQGIRWAVLYIIALFEEDGMSNKARESTAQQLTPATAMDRIFVYWDEYIGDEEEF